MQHLKIQVHGIVQGVGFRPFVHRLAVKYNLLGYAYNDAQGVIIHIQGKPEDTEMFLKELKSDPPQLASIETIDIASLPVKPYVDFEIRNSQNGLHQTLISPDIAPCKDCIRELLDPTDRRYHYPFINCTNCGPRYSIIQDIPYDRKNTTMKAFKLCDKCEHEYHDINDRRYHAQPNACAVCGPKLLYTGKQTTKDALTNAILDLKEGKIVAIKGIGGIHLACDAKNKHAVECLRKRKQRETKPLAVMVKDIDVAKEFVNLDKTEEQYLLSKERPIILCEKKDPESYMELSENRELGIFLPYSPLHILLLEECQALVMTSANLSDTPVLIDNTQALGQLKDIADSFLLHDRAIENRCDDSLMRIIQNKPYFIRRSRGYVPMPIYTNLDVNGILAVGAHQKGSFALGKKHHVFLSPYIGNMETIETFEHYKKALETYQRLFAIMPNIVACDKHPDYTSSHFAKNLNLSLIQVQHHHAHMASCMFEHGLNEKCFGIIWDGTGLGDDNTIWGAEFLIGDLKGYQRVGSIRPIDLIGNEQAIQEIGRVALVLSQDAHIETCLFNQEKQEALKKIRHTISTPASSMGRLFDGCYSLLTKKTSQNNDGQAPVLLEAMASNVKDSYSIDFYQHDSIRYFDWRIMIQEMLLDPANNKEKATKMMNTIINMTIDQVHTLNLDRLPVILSGGCFQNKTLLTTLITSLTKEGYKVYWHEKVSCNDEGIAFGQLAIASQKRK